MRDIILTQEEAEVLLDEVDTSIAANEACLEELFKDNFVDSFEQLQTSGADYIKRITVLGRLKQRLEMEVCHE